MTTKLTVLGCGGSLGVANLMNRWGDCDPSNPKNHRMRTSAWVTHEGKNFLIDTSPDLRTQIHTHGLAGIRPEVILYTHIHADHSHGIDDLRSYYWAGEKIVDVYGAAAHMDELSRRFDYLFYGNAANPLYANPMLKSHVILPGQNTLAGADFTVIEMKHGDINTYGYRFGDIAWCTDFKSIPDAGMEALRGVKIWFAAVSDWDSKHPSHATLDDVLGLCEKLGNPKTYLIHLNPRLDYDFLNSKTPSHVMPAHDGLVVES